MTREVDGGERGKLMGDLAVTRQEHIHTTADGGLEGGAHPFLRSCSTFVDGHLLLCSQRSRAPQGPLGWLLKFLPFQRGWGQQCA